MRLSLRIWLNGEAQEVPDGISLSELVAHLGLAAERIAVEVNLRVVRRSDWGTTRIEAEDRLEVVHFVGGGFSKSGVKSD